MPKTTAWRRVTGETAIGTDDLDAFADALDMTVIQLIQEAEDIRQKGRVYDPPAARRGTLAPTPADGLASAGEEDQDLGGMEPV